MATPPPRLPAPADTPAWAARLLRTPLLTKLIFLDLGINLATVGVLQATPPHLADQVTLGSLLVVLVLNAALVAWALRPLGVLEAATRRVSAGDFSARVEMPWLADRNLVRIGDTLDELLDRVASERARVRSLAAQVVAAGDQERARIARELHDGTAQSLSALEMLVASTLGGSPPPPPELAERLAVMREIATEALTEVRALSHTVHPRVLDDLGLKAALEWLARRTRVGAELDVVVDGALPEPLPGAVCSVLYRVAQEAIHNAVKHGGARTVHVELSARDGAIELAVSDDGRGFDRREVDAKRGGMGLFVMEERVGLMDGRIEIASTPGTGTVVRATIPLGPAALGPVADGTAAPGPTGEAP